MSEKHFLAFDFGAESGRAILGTLRDGTLQLAERHRFANPTARLLGRMHWNTLGQWEQIKTGLRQTAGTKLSGIGVDTWGVDFGLISGRDGLLANPVHYRDARTARMMQRAFELVGREAIFRATGCQFIRFNTLYQLLAMRETNSAVLGMADTLLMMPDLFNYFLSGLARCEFSIATTTQMYDPRRKSWATDLLEMLGLPTHILPSIIPSGTILGPLLPDVARECGIESAPIIAPACHDTGSAVAAVPVEGDQGGWCFISSGTWSLMGVELDSPLINDQIGRLNYTNEGGVGGSIRLLKNIMGMWLVQECRRELARQGTDHDYARLTAMAAESSGLRSIIDPDHAPFMLPGDMPGKIRCFCHSSNQPVPQSPGELVRCCLDSLALAYRDKLAELEEIVGRRLDVIHIVGGGSRNELLNQLAADACNRPVIAGPVEATAIGNLLAQAMGTEDIRSLAELRQVVRQSFAVKRYEPRDTSRWDEAYARFRLLLHPGR